MREKMNNKDKNEKKNKEQNDELVELINQLKAEEMVEDRINNSEMNENDKELMREKFRMNQNQFNKTKEEQKINKTLSRIIKIQVTFYILLLIPMILIYIKYIKKASTLLALIKILIGLIPSISFIYRVLLVIAVLLLIFIPLACIMTSILCIFKSVKLRKKVKEYNLNSKLSTGALITSIICLISISTYLIISLVEFYSNKLVLD